jgi:hypothetical protein
MGVSDFYPDEPSALVDGVACGEAGSRFTR